MRKRCPAAAATAAATSDSRACAGFQNTLFSARAPSSSVSAMYAWSGSPYLPESSVLKMWSSLQQVSAGGLS